MIPTKKVAKFLIYSNNQNEIYYELGRYGLYVHKIKMLTEVSDKHNPYAVMAITDNDKNIERFIQGTDLKAIRLFKTVMFSGKYNKPPTKFVYTACRNLVGLLHGKTIRVESNDKDIQDIFYKVCVEINDEFNFGCKFDFDVYDVAFVIKSIKISKKKKKTRIFLTTYFYGNKYPNVKLKPKLFDWNMLMWQWRQWNRQPM